MTIGSKNKMEHEDQIGTFLDFMNQNYKSEMLDAIRKNQQFIVLDFSKIALFNPNLAEQILDDPIDTIKNFELAIDDQFNTRAFKVRFCNLPSSHQIEIRDIRSIHLNKLYYFEGIVRQKSDVRPQVVLAKFECPGCGNIIVIPQLGVKFNEPTSCSCGRRGKFKLIDQELIDYQGLVLEESPDQLDGGQQPKRINVLLKDDLVSPITDKSTNPGAKIRIYGNVKEIPIEANGTKTTQFDLLIDANNVEAMQEDFYNIIISPEDEQEIKDLSNDPKLYKKLVNSLAPSIYGHDEIKESILLQLVGGIKKYRPDGTSTRGDIHMLLIGDPGAGKTQLIKRTAAVAPKARFVSGKGASGAGLTASVVKNEFLGGWALEAGALVLANKGIACLDELDKMSQEDTAAMHEALEGQQITISKANIQATLKCETTVLAAANPKYGRFDPYDELAKQIQLPPALINRFDLIFPIKDIPNVKRDEITAGHILALHKDPESAEVDIENDLLRKYLAFCRRNAKPELTDSAISELQSFYVKMRNSGKGSGELKAVPISARQLEAMVRLSEASAKLRLSDKVTKKDAERAIRLLTFCLSQVGVDPETGEFDIDRISSGISQSQRNKIKVIKDIISQLENQNNEAPIDLIITEAKNQGVDESKCEDIINKLKREGEIYEPRHGIYHLASKRQ